MKPRAPASLSARARAPATPCHDGVVHHLEMALASARGRCSPAFVDHVTKAMSVHLANDEQPATLRGALSRWQQELAQKLLGGKLETAIAIEDVAKACDLSPGHFTRAFKKSTGSSPHRWRLARRIEGARRLLLDPRRSLSDVAAATGFADQSHLARAFKRATGSTPSDYRRTYESNGRGHIGIGSNSTSTT